jgi:hypothetical protein
MKLREQKVPRNWSWGHKRKSGFRSGLEEKVAQTLTDKEVKWEYEVDILEYKKKVNKGLCGSCGERVLVFRRATYKPDFKLDNGIYIEVKGRLTASDRTKLLAVRESNPGLRLVLYFGSDNKLQKNSEKRYSDWAQQHKFDFSIDTLPRRWLNRKSN